jgi:CBS domain-containing protein
MQTASIRQPIRARVAAPAFEDATVVDAMRIGVISCPPDTPLRDVARIMATYRIHCVVVSEMEGAHPLGVISDVDLAQAAVSDSPEGTAGQLAGTESVTVAASDPLARAAQLMAEHQVSHLVVVQPHTSHPVGVLSALDLAGVLAWGGSA